MSSAILLRRQLRLVAQAALGSIDGLTVISPGDMATPPNKFPAVLLRTPAERKVGGGRAQIQFTTTTTLELCVRVSAKTEEDCQDALEALCQQVEDAVFGRFASAPPSLISGIAGVTTTTEFSSANDTHLGEAVLSIDVEAYELFDPTVIDPGAYPALEQVLVNVDTVRPFDASGTYGPAFPGQYDIPPAPRTTGPDGRNEALLALDMVQRTPLQRFGLSVSGRQLLGPDGAPIRLRGYNWGQWGAAQQQDASAAAAARANSVRIPLRWWGLYGDAFVDSRDDLQLDTARIDAGHLRTLDAMVAWASQARLWITLFVDSNCGADGTQPGEAAYCDPLGLYPNGHNFWTDPVARAQFIALWQFIARRYKDTPYLGLFEPLPEPGPVGYSGHDIRDFYVEVCGAIDLVAPGVPKLVGGDTYKAPNIGAAFMPGVTGIVYTADLFLHTAGGSFSANMAEFQARVQNCIDFQNAHDACVHIQQTGAQSIDDPTQAYCRAMLASIEAAGFGWHWWQYKDKGSPDGYGMFYSDGAGGWIPKQPLIDAINSFIP